jgi:hypothetical protein
MSRSWCVIPILNVDGVMGGVSVIAWNAKRHFLERLSKEFQIVDFWRFFRYVTDSYLVFI